MPQLNFLKIVIALPHPGQKLGLGFKFEEEENIKETPHFLHL